MAAVVKVVAENAAKHLALNSKAGSQKGVGLCFLKEKFYLCGQKSKKTKPMKKTLMIAAAVVLACNVGCKSQSVEEKLAEFTQWNESFMESFRSGMEELKEDREAMSAYRDSLMEEYQEYNLAALKNGLKDTVGVCALRNLSRIMDVEELAEYIEKLEAPVAGKDSAFVAGMKNTVVALNNTKIGSMFTDFEVEHVIGEGENGELVTEPRHLSDYVGKGKVVLVDFWSPWCPPCKAELPNIKAVWEKYHGDDFDVLSVAVWEESRGMNWRNTIDTAAVYGVQWNQINNGHQEPASLYGIRGIPYMVLFDAEGKIIARGDDLRGEDLEPAVAKALGK